MTPDQFRLEQIAWGALGAAAGLAAGLLMASTGSSPLGIVALAGVGGVSGLLLRDRRLGQQARRRRDRIDQQLPAMAELLAFAVAAGEAPVAALERIGATSAGDLADEIRATAADIRSGASVEAALGSMADRCDSGGVRRFVSGLLVAMERGTPLAEVLRAQAADARAAEQRVLMEVAGRKDVLMLVPVVFLILPTVVLIALFPGVQGLRLVVP